MQEERHKCGKLKMAKGKHQKAPKCTNAKKKIRQNAKPVTNAKGKWRM